MPKLWSYHVNNLFKLICLSSALCLMSCNKDTPQSHEHLTEQLEAIKPSASVDIANIPGETDAEKLMYLLDIATATKAATLIFLDSQIDAFEAAGNSSQANSLRENRVLLLQALNEKIDIYVKQSAEIYEGFYTDEELAAYVDIFSRPEMQKFTRSTVTLQQKAVPIATAWSENHVVPRYTELLKEKAGK